MTTDSTVVVDIRLKNHSNPIGNLVKNLKREHKNITLVSSDKQKYVAHMEVICACSKFLKDALSELLPWCYNHQHPIIKLKIVKGNILKKILEFMYEGKTCVEGKNWATFVKCSKKLRVIGIDCHVAQDIAEVSNQSCTSVVQIIPTYNADENYYLVSIENTRIRKDSTTPNVQGTIKSSMVLSEYPTSSGNRLSSVESKAKETEKTHAKLKAEIQCLTGEMKKLQDGDQREKEIGGMFNSRPNVEEETFSLSKKKVIGDNHTTKIHETTEQCESKTDSGMLLSLFQKKKMNEQEILFMCPICDKEFKHNSILVKHMRIHSPERPFMCSICGKGFKQSGTLTRHVRVHSSEKPFMCNVCGKGFIQQGNLIKHVRVHSGERPFKCSKCGKRFRQKQHLVKHKETHNSQEDVSCPLCVPTVPCVLHDLSKK